jgi:hypothetical protein
MLADQRDHHRTAPLAAITKSWKSTVSRPTTAVSDTTDTTHLNLTATDSVAEGGSIVYTATLTNPAGTPVTVTLSNGAVITIEAGKTVGTVSVPAPADDVYKDAGKVEATISDSDWWQLREPGAEYCSGSDQCH